MSINRWSDQVKYMLGPQVISKLIAIQHPMIMVDNIIGFNSSLKELTADRLVSLNEPVFESHFPEFKLWPGIYSIEGLRQCCLLYEMIEKVENAGLMTDLLSLQDLLAMKPVRHSQRVKVIQQFLSENSLEDSGEMKIKVKLINPVFAGSILNYKVSQDNDTWQVSAMAKGRIVADGTISRY